MKKNITTVVLLATLSLAYGQSNTFPTTGNVGIGTSTPSEKLEINGDVKLMGVGNKKLSIYSKDTNGNGTVQYLNNSMNYEAGIFSDNQYGINAGAIRVFTIGTDGNVGLGTTGPQAKLDVNGSLRVTENANIFYNNKMVGWDDPNNYYIGHYPVPGSSGLNIQWYGGIKLGVGLNRNAMQILESGNVGIGTATPQAKLDVNGSLRVTENANIFYNNKMVGWDDPNNYYIGQYTLPDTSGLDIHWHGGIKFGVGGNHNAMQILESGNVGIGTSSPQAKLHIDFGGEPKSILFREAESNAINSMISMMRFKWYDNTADFGMVRSDNYPIEALAVRFNEQETARFTPNGNVSVKNKLEAKEVKVTATPTADFVFAEDYQLPKLEAVEKHIKDKKHLPEIASAKEMEKEGVNVGDFQIKLLQKIEELTLYTIEQNKQNKLQEEQLKKQEEELNQLKTQNKELQELKKTVHELIQKNNQ